MSVEKNTLVRVANLVRIRNQYTMNSNLWKVYDKRICEELDYYSKK